MLGRVSIFVGAALALGAAAIASAAAQAPEPAAAPPPPDWDMVSFEVKSWGAPIGSWRILSNGGGSWTETVRKEGAAYGDYQLAWHEIEPDAANYVALERILRKLPEPAPDSQSCDNFMTDAPYGILRLTKGATTTEIAWNDGCMDDGYRSFMGILREADEHMTALGKAAPVSRTESPPAG